MVELVIIGGGPAGLAAAYSAWQHGLRDILILERDAELGGIFEPVHPQRVWPASVWPAAYRPGIRRALYRDAAHNRRAGGTGHHGAGSDPR